MVALILVAIAGTVIALNLVVALSALTHVVSAPVLRRFEAKVLEGGDRNATDRLLLPLLSSLTGALLGAFAAIYVTGNPTVWQRVAASAIVLLTVLLFGVLWWNGPDRDLPQQLFELSKRPGDAALEAQIVQSIARYRRYQQLSGEASRPFGIVLSALDVIVLGGASVGLWIRPEEYGRTVALGWSIASVTALGMVLILTFVGWPRQRVREARRLNNLEIRLQSIAAERVKALAKAAEQVAQEEKDHVELVRRVLVEVLQAGIEPQVTAWQRLRSLLRPVHARADSRAKRENSVGGQTDV